MQGQTSHHTYISTYLPTYIHTYIHTYNVQVAEALIAGRKVEPQTKSCVSIFVSDIVGYTLLSQKMNASQVSDMLDRCVCVHVHVHVYVHVHVCLFMNERVSSVRYAR